MTNPERVRLDAEARREHNWKRWGPYLSERQWGTVREDYSADGTCWTYFPHDHARSRAYRWGEDGLLGICDRQCRLCFALALWNGRDPILKERPFGLGGPEGNHGEDVKDYWYYLDGTPTSSYLRALYKYPQAEFPYARLVEENRRRGRLDREFELADTGVFDGGRYFDVTVEYAKAAAEDIAIRITVANRGPDAATLHLLPTLWFRNTWSWGRTGEDFAGRPALRREAAGSVFATHAALGDFRLVPEPGPGGAAPELLFTDNETNSARLFGVAPASPHVKDAFHEFVIHGRKDAVHPDQGTKAAFHYVLDVPAGGEYSVHLRLLPAAVPAPVLNRREQEQVLELRRHECDAFHETLAPRGAGEDERRVMRQGYAGLVWSRQFYEFVVREWLEGDPAQPPAPMARWTGRNHGFQYLHARDVLSMPDAWEYPWFAAWDLAFHMIPFARLDPEFAKSQLILLLREWYMHPNGQLPAYEFEFGDVNPPVHAWACWRTYKLTGARGHRDRLFLERTFQKLLINFTWWVNRKDLEGHHLFGGGFLGLDNIGVFDRSKPLPTGGRLEQADGTAWMAFFCTTMLAMALELASEDPAYEDVASKFFEHFVAIADAMNSLGGTGLWDETDGFYYDQLQFDGITLPLKIRSMVGIIPLFAVENLEQDQIAKLPGFSKRMNWFLENRKDLGRDIAYMAHEGHPETDEDRGGMEAPEAADPAERGVAANRGETGHRHLAMPSRQRLERVLRYVLDENEFLSPHGIRSLSKVHEREPYQLDVRGAHYRVDYAPGESTSGLFGGNSNWRGPVWFPLNFLLIEALERYDHFYGPEFQVECPTGSGHRMTLAEVARELQRRLTTLVLKDDHGERPCDGGDRRLADDPHWRDLVSFHEYFDGDTGRGCGASHQTGWTALVVTCLEDVIRERGRTGATGAAGPTGVAGQATAGAPRTPEPRPAAGG